MADLHGLAPSVGSWACASSSVPVPKRGPLTRITTHSSRAGPMEPQSKQMSGCPSCAGFFSSAGSGSAQCPRQDPLTTSILSLSFTRVLLGANISLL